MATDTKLGLHGLLGLWARVRVRVRDRVRVRVRVKVRIKVRIGSQHLAQKMVPSRCQGRPQ